MIVLVLMQASVAKKYIMARMLITDSGMYPVEPTLVQILCDMLGFPDANVAMERLGENFEASVRQVWCKMAYLCLIVGTLDRC